MIIIFCLILLFLQLACRRIFKKVKIKIEITKFYWIEALIASAFLSQSVFKMTIVMTIQFSIVPV